MEVETGTFNRLRSRMRPNNAERPSTLQAAASSSSRAQVQVEPKTYFANERTFIQWISAALLLLTVSSVLVSGGKFNGTSSVIALSSLILVGYATYVYFRRVYRLRSGDAYGYLDFLGPSFLAAGVGIGVGIVFLDAIKGSEILPFGSGRKDDRRFLMAPLLQQVSDFSALGVRPIDHSLKEVDGTCSRHTLTGINLLEYEPRDILFNPKTNQYIAATPQTLISHSQLDTSSTLLSEIPDTDIQSVVIAGDGLFALSTGPSKTELVGFNAQYEVGDARFLIEGSKSASASMAFVPLSSNSTEKGSLYIYLNGSMHRYNLPCKDCSLETTGSINMKVLNRGADHVDPIVAMEYFEGLLYILRGQMIEAWNLPTSTLIAHIPLPKVAKNDRWVGMAFQRRNEGSSPLHVSQSAVYLRMALDSFPPQHWSFRLMEDVEDSEYTVFSFPACGVSIN